MPEVRETSLPGVGVRHEFDTASGDRVAVLTHSDGQHEIAMYDRDDPDSTALHLGPIECRTLAELLGATQIREALAAVRHEVDGLAIEWLTLHEASPVAGTSIAEIRIPSPTDPSIVAILRGTRTILAPARDYRLAAGDVLVVVGTPEGLADLHRLVDS